MIRTHGDATCPHLTTSLYCVCREQGHNPARGCLAPIHLSVRPAQIDGDTLCDCCHFVELDVPREPATEVWRSSA